MIIGAGIILSMQKKYKGRSKLLNLFLPEIIKFKSLERPLNFILFVCLC